MTTDVATLAELVQQLAELDTTRRTLIARAIETLQHSVNGSGENPSPLVDAPVLPPAPSPARPPRDSTPRIQRPMDRTALLKLLGQGPRTARELAITLHHSRDQIRRALTRLLRERKILRSGATHSTRYALAPPAAESATEDPRRRGHLERHAEPPRPPAPA